MKIGAQISTSGGVLNVFPRAQELGVNCFQIFASSPRQWKVNSIDGRIATEFSSQLTQKLLSPSFIHIKYLVNIGSFDTEIYKKSVQCIKEELRLASQLGLSGGMFHIGAPKNGVRSESMKLVVDGCKEILNDIPENVLLILENSASHKKLGGELKEIAELLDQINSNRIGVCLDTAHALAAGYDLRTDEGVNQWVEDINNTVGVEKVSLFHLNDSKSDLNSGRDLHENVGEGKIGLNSFAVLLNHPKLTHTPFILEVPGFENQGPDKKNVDIVKSLIRYHY